MDKCQNILKLTFIFIALLIQPSFAAKKNDSSEFEFQKSSPKTIQNFYKIVNEHQHKSLTRLSQLKNQIKSATIHDAQRLVKALKHIEKGQLKAALNLLDSIHKKFILDEYVSYYKSKALLDLKEYQSALALVPAQDNPSKKIDLMRFWLRMELLALTKNKTEVYKAVDTLKKKRRKDKWVDIKGNYYKGLAELTDNQKTEARKLFAKILVYDPGTIYDQMIFDLLKTKGIKKSKVLDTTQWNLRAENLIKDGFPHLALQIWQNFADHNKTYVERVAYGTHRSRDYKKSAILYEDLLNSNDHDLSDLEILSQIGQAHSRSDNFPKAIEIYKKILKDHPQTRAASLANFKLGFLYFDSGQYKKAATYLEKFLTNGSNWQRDRARWFRLWSYYLTKDYDQALVEIEFMQKNGRKKKSERIMLDYWRARLLDKKGQKKEAQDLYRSVVQNDRLDYYGLLARQRLKYRQLFPRTLINPKVIHEAPSATHKDSEEAPRFKSVKSSDALVKAILLNQMGLYNFAFDESRYSEHYKTAASYDIAKSFEWAGNYTNGYAMRSRLRSGSVTNVDERKAFELGFPQAYQHYVAPFASMWGIEPQLAYSIMRQESAFKPEALSYAAAYGLMQIIPPTAEEITQKTGYEGFEIEQLNDPPVNILFGTFYLSYLMQRFENNLIYTIAGYNAGPDAVSRWKVKAPGMEVDEFIELIPYKQTNDYVKKVLVNYLIYKKLYE